MTQFLFEVEFKGAIRYEAPTAWEAISRLRDQLDVCDANLGAWDWGDPILCEIGITDRRPVLVEADGKPVLDGDTARGLNAFGESALCTNASEPDTSDIPEAGPAFWRNAKLARPPHLDPRELGTVLAALRFYQEEFLGKDEFVSEHDLAVVEIATNCDSEDPMTAPEIDALCERLNTSPDPLAIPSAADLRKSRLADAGEDMLAALQSFVDRWSKYPKKPSGADLEIYLAEARAAIAKAKGEEIAEPKVKHWQMVWNETARHWVVFNAEGDKIESSRSFDDAKQVILDNNGHDPFTVVYLPE